MQFPLVEELVPPPDVERSLAALARRPGCVFLDSALVHPVLGRYSFLAADPFHWMEFPAGASDALSLLGAALARYPADHVAGLPPFQGGAAGLFSYDLNRSLERLPAPRADEFAVPALAVGLYDVVLAFDVVAGRAWAVSQGYPESEPPARLRRAEQRLRALKGWLKESRPVAADSARSARDAIGPEQMVPQYPTQEAGDVTSNFSAEDYRGAVRRVIEYIQAGDVFQVNLAQRLLHPARGDSLDLYLRLRRCNPAPFSGYFDLGMFQLASASPERFLRVRDGWVETRPIKGTRRRSLSPEADLFAGDELRLSEKDRAENVMIVDLLRNDLSRVCTPESIRVTQLCGLELYPYVQHLVSAVEGRLEASCRPLDLVQAAFPGGSITGAPKVRAMEIIAELEPSARGAYCGSLGYIGFDGAMDLSILIRTITAGRGWWQLPVGGGVVAQSDPRAEYEETWHKAAGLLRALRNDPAG